MSHWNYRVGFKRHKVAVVDDVDHKPTGEYHEELEFGIVECYYDDNGDIRFTTERFMKPYGESYEKLVDNLQIMLKDAQKAPTLDLEVLWKELEAKGELDVE